MNFDNDPEVRDRESLSDIRSRWVKAMMEDDELTPTDINLIDKALGPKEQD